LVPDIFVCRALGRWALLPRGNVLIPAEQSGRTAVYFSFHQKENIMRKFLFVAAAIGAMASPALADEVGVQVGPVGAGVTVGESHPDYDRDRVRERTVIKEHEPTDRTTIIKKEHPDGTESKTVIHRDGD
jgi:hypothetical protein